MTNQPDPKRYHIPITPAVLAAYQKLLEWGRQEREKAARQETEAPGEAGRDSEANK